MSTNSHDCREDAGVNRVVRRTRLSVLLALALAAFVAVMLVGCGGGNGSSASASGPSGSQVTGESASSQAVEESSSAAVSEEARKAFVGTWEVVSIVGSDGDKSGNLDAMHEQGVQTFMNLYDSGEAAFVNATTNTYGDWTATSETTGELDMHVLFGKDYTEGKTETSITKFEMELQGSTLTVKILNTTYTFEKGENKDAISKEEYRQGLDAFTGTWHSTGVLPFGFDSRVEAPATTIVLEESSRAIVNYNDEDHETRWAVTGPATAVIYGGIGSATLLDGEMQLDVEGLGAMYFVKE